MKLTKFNAILLVVGAFLAFVECQNPTPPIITYTRSPANQRVEYIRADISQNHLRRGNAVRQRGTTPQTRAYAQRMGSPNDDAGHLIAARLGGTGSETYNIIPQNSNINRGNFRVNVETRVFNDVANGNTVIYELWPRYRTAADTRPYELGYAARRANGGAVVLPYATIQNPPSPPRNG